MKKHLIAIGDIHGMVQPLKLLLGHIAREFSPDDTRIVFLGDLVDRGPNSLAVVSLVSSFIDRFPGSALCLGNHDAYMRHMSELSLSRDEEIAWMRFGGVATLASYGLDHHDLVEAGKAFNLQYPEHTELFRAATTHVETERHFFTHAGIDPSEPLSNQAAHDLMWIREGFLDHDGPFEKIIVHGHSITPSKMPEVHANRIALDTGSYSTGRISAAIFVDDELAGFVCAEDSEGKRSIRRFDAVMAGEHALETI